MKLKLSSTQVWVLIKSLEHMASEEGVNRLLTEFPKMDEDALIKDIEGIVTQLEEHL